MEESQELESPEGSIGKPGIDDGEGDAVRFRLSHVLGPELAVDGEGHVGPDARPGELGERQPIEREGSLRQDLAPIFFLRYGQAGAGGSAKDDFHIGVGKQVFEQFSDG